MDMCRFFEQVRFAGLFVVGLGAGDLIFVQAMFKDPFAAIALGIVVTGIGLFGIALSEKSS